MKWNENWKTKIEDFSFKFLNKNWKLKLKKKCLFSIFNFELKLKCAKMPFFISILNWKLNGTFGARIIFFEIRFSISNQKIIFKSLKFIFRFFIWKVSHQILFWLVGSKIQLKLLWNWIKLFKTFTAVGWRLKRTS